MSATEGFYATWEKARTTFGDGAPQTGDQFDDSGKLTQLGADVETATPGSRWTGAAADSYAKANAEHREVLGKLADLDRRLAAEVNNSAQVVGTGRTNLEAIRQWVQAADASVPNGDVGERIRMAIAKKGLAELEEVIKTSNSTLNAIGRQIGQLGSEFQALGNQRFAEDKPGQIADPTEEEEAPEEQGAQDSQALQDGSATAEQLERLIANTTLAPNQQTALDKGDLVLPPSQMAYLQGYSRAFGDKTPAQTQAVMEDVGPVGARVADVFQLASNPHIKTGLFKSDPPSIGQPSGGGKHALPDGVLKVLEGPVLTPLGYGPPIENPDGTIGLPEIVTPSQPVDGLNDLANIVQQGNRDLQMGTALDVGMLEKGRQLLEMSNGWAVPGNDLEHERPRWYHQMVDPTLQNMFNAVNADDIVIHDAITGESGKSFLDHITQHQWQDDGLAAGGLFDWIAESAANDVGGRAAATAHTLAEYTAEHSHRLLNLPDTDNLALGQVNPELTRDWARAFSPYFDDMVGMNTGDSNGLFAPLDLDSEPNPEMTRKLMSVLYSDHPPAGEQQSGNAAQTASQILSESSRGHIDEYLDIGARSAADGTPGEDNFAMKSAGKLLAALDLGAYDERFNATHDQFEAQKQSYEVRSRVFDLGKDFLGELPGGSAAGGLGSLAKDFWLGAEPVMPGVDTIPGRDMFPAQLEMAQTLITERAGDPHLLEIVRAHLDTDGNFVVPTQDGSAVYAKFRNDVTSFLSSVGRPGVLDDMTQSYWNAYMQAIINAAPSS